MRPVQFAGRFDWRQEPTSDSPGRVAFRVTPEDLGNLKDLVTHGVDNSVAVQWTTLRNGDDRVEISRSGGEPHHLDRGEWTREQFALIVLAAAHAVEKGQPVSDVLGFISRR